MAQIPENSLAKIVKFISFCNFKVQNIVYAKNTRYDLKIRS